MSSLEGPAHGSEQSTASRGLPEAPPLTPERAQQELGKLAEIIASNETLNFLEPRVRRCQESGSADLPTLLSFYRLISQALSEELGTQKDALAASKNALVQAKQTSAQAAMQAALDEASVMVTDAFYQAMPTLKTTNDITSVITGVTMIHDQLQESLEKAGLTRLKVLGQPFDPRFHEAIGEVPCNDIADEHIYDELQPGYLLGERIIRAAMVRLARNDGPPPAPKPPVEAAAPIPLTLEASPPAPNVSSSPLSVPSPAPAVARHEETSSTDPNP